MSTDTVASHVASQAGSAKVRDKRYLFGPFVDFFCLGGVSLLVLPLLFLVPANTYELQLSSFMLLLANVINHPHFAHSYQIFYRGFGSKAFTPELGRSMQLRYLFAGIGVPILLTAFFAWCILSGDVKLLGQGGNIMLLFVGWHYVKQGYGMLMLDAALKRNFFNEREKKLLLVNSYAVWIAAWLSANAYVSSRQLAGLQYYSFDVPQPLLLMAQLMALATSLAAGWALFRHWQTSRRFLVNGVMAYVMALYVWLLFVRINPLWVFVVPALHSLQYLVVVWRFELNYGKEHASRQESRGALGFGNSLAAHLVWFGLGGLTLGFLGFWGLPLLLSDWMTYDRAIFGSALFVFVAWIFINIHHYFIDNVMWRRENPDARRFLFS